MDLIMQYLPTVIGVVATGLALALAWGIRKIGLEAGLEKALTDFVDRGIDKAKVELQLATDPASDGGAKITGDEASKLRQLIFDYAKAEMKGPLAKLAFTWGEKRVKGFISGILKSKGVVTSGDDK